MTTARPSSACRCEQTGQGEQSLPGQRRRRYDRTRRKCGANVRRDGQALETDLLQIAGPLGVGRRDRPDGSQFAVIGADLGQITPVRRRSRWWRYVVEHGPEFAGIVEAGACGRYEIARAK